VALNAYARFATDRLVNPVARVLVRLGATANALTFVGLAGTIAGMVVVLAVSPRVGAAVLVVFTAIDALDGAVARLRGTSGPLGAFYDSVTDRVGDAVLLGGAAWIVRDDPLLFTVAMTAFGGAQVTSYIRAKAEALGWSATVGIIERSERVIILVLSLLLGFLPVALWILAVGSLVTIAQRLVAVVRQARAPAPAPGP
jgi:CDP-diacylglycerol---glycerol-3-phosphate 3-phosphatidyltransferase